MDSRGQTVRLFLMYTAAAIVNFGCGLSASVTGKAGAGITSSATQDFKPLIMGSKPNQIITSLDGYAPMRVQLRSVYSMRDLGDLNTCLALENTYPKCAVNDKACVPVAKDGPESQKEEQCLRNIMKSVEAANAQMFNTNTSVTHLRFEWDFGTPVVLRRIPDSNKTYQMEHQEGFAASYVYDKPGIYKISLKVTREDGTSAVTSEVLVNVAERPKTYSKIYVSSSDGTDANAGNTESAPIKTLARANALLVPGAEVALKRGDTFPEDSEFLIKDPNVRIASYGQQTFPKPVILWNVATKGANQALIKTISDKNDSLNTIIEDLTLNTATTQLFGNNADFSKAGAPLANGGMKYGLPHGIVVGAHGLLVRNVTYLNVNYALDNEFGHNDVLVVGSSAPLDHGLRSYFAWNSSGVNQHLIGNRCANSTREHCARSSQAHLFTVEYANDFENKSFQDDADPLNRDSLDYSKSSVNNQFGYHFTVRENTFTQGAISAGPLTGADGHGGTMVAYGIIENNELGDGASVQLQNGTIDVAIRSNHIVLNVGPGAPAATAIVMPIFDPDYHRSAERISIEKNSIDVVSTGGSCWVLRRSTGTRVTDNVCRNTQMNSSQNGTALFIVEGDLSKAVDLAAGNKFEIPKFYRHGSFNRATDSAVSVETPSTTLIDDWLRQQTKLGWSLDIFTDSIQ